MVKALAFFLFVLALGCGDADDGGEPVIPRTKASGWSAFEGLTSAQMNTLDQSQVLMTDSRLVREYSMALNFPDSFASDVRMGVYDPVHERMVFIGAGPISWYSLDGVTLVSGGAPAATGGWAVTSMAASSTGVVVAISDGTNGAGQRVRRSDDGGVSWTTVIVGPLDLTSINYVVWYERQRLFVATGGGGANSALIYTSPDGMTWTESPAPTGWPASTGIGSIAVGDGTLVAFPPWSAPAKTVYAVTHDATDWSGSLRTLDTGAAIADTFWSAEREMFVAIGSPCLLGQPDGGAWVTNGVLTASSATPHAGAAYRSIFAAIGTGGLFMSVDYGATWRLVLKTGALNLQRMVFGMGRFYAFSGSVSGTQVGPRLTLD